MDTKTLGEVLRFISQHEALPQVEEAFPDYSLSEIKDSLAALASKVSPESSGAPSTVGSKSGRITLKSDGGSRGNPGPSGAGWVLFDSSGKVVATGNEFLGKRTNNEAEYAAALLGLQSVLELGYTEVDLRLDSELLVKQIKGIYRVKKPHLKPLHEQVCILLKKFDDSTVEHVYRDQNKEADEQANIAMDRGY